MRVSNFPITTLKEAPANAEIISHQLMLRAGLIRRLASGLYTWLPLGLKVLRKVECVVREEMNASGGLELLMPTIQPGELWEQSGRWEQYGAELLRLKDRHDRDFCYGPTHEEVITDLASKEIHSYKQLPLNYFQIQLKFRDERRPRFGVMRAREFLMKDAYSFHLTQASLQETYELMHQTYCRIFDRLGLEYRPVAADGGSIGGNYSHEFHVLAESGEDAIAVSDQSDYAANIELAATLPQDTELRASMQLAKVSTPAKKSIQDVADFLSVGIDQCLKMLVVHGKEEGEFIGIIMRGDHQLNEIKAEKIDAIKSPLTLASETEVQTLFACETGFLGPYNAPDIPLYADYAALAVNDFICGANETDMHYQGVNWERDLPIPTAADLRNVNAGDPSPDGQGNLVIRRGIEVGHIFQLGTKYSEKLNCNVLDENGKSQTLTMGCYGIGVSRIVAAAIEQNNDARGIIWPASMSPYDVYLAPINLHKSVRLKEAVEALYERLQTSGFNVLFDDRKIRPGAMFADMDLIGIPHRIVFSEKGLDKGTVEYSKRGEDADAQHIALDDIVTLLTTPK